MRSSSILVSGLVNLAFAQQQVVTLLLPGFDAQALVGSIIASDAAATTYSIQCAPGTDGSDCGAPASFTLTQGPKTLHYSIAVPEESLTLDASCSLDGTTLAICSGGYSGAGATGQESIQTTATLSASDISNSFQPVTITDKLAPNTLAAATTTDGSDTAVSTGAAAVTTSGSSSPSTTAGSTLGVSGAGSVQVSSTSTAGAPGSTGYGAFVAGGIAAAVAFAGL